MRPKFIISYKFIHSRITGTEQKAEEGSIHNSHDSAHITEGTPSDWNENIREYKMKVEKK